MDTQGLLKSKLLWNNGYDVIVPVHDVTNKILSRDSNYIEGLGILPKFFKSSISKDLIRKNFFWRVVLVHVQ